MFYLKLMIKTFKYCNIAVLYRKRGKIRWAKLLWIPPNEVIHGKTFAVPDVSQYLSNAIIYTCKYSRENFRGALENRESLAQRIFPCLQYLKEHYS